MNHSLLTGHLVAALVGWGLAQPVLAQSALTPAQAAEQRAKDAQAESRAAQAESRAAKEKVRRLEEEVQRLKRSQAAVPPAASTALPATMPAAAATFAASATAAPAMAASIPARAPPPQAQTAAAGPRFRRMEDLLQVAGCPACGQMSQVEAGEFNMGSPADEPQRYDDEGPVHRVKLARFEIGRTEVTQGQWRALMGRNPSRFQECGDACPVDSVSWDDITGPDGFLVRLRRATGQTYRLPSEAEWEFGARAGTTTPFWWGQQITPRKANYNDKFLYGGGGEKGEYRQKTMRADSLEANAWGLYQVHGNVWEWVQDCWHGNYKGAPSNGAAWERDCEETRRVLRGGSWSGIPRSLRAANRSGGAPDDRFNITGFRLARTF